MKRFARIVRRLFLCLFAACFSALLVCQWALWRQGEDGVARIAAQLGAELKTDMDKVAAAGGGEAALFVYLTLEAAPADSVTLLVNGTAVGDFGQGMLGVKVFDGDTLALRAQEAGWAVSIVDFPPMLDSAALSAQAVTVRGELSLGVVRFR